MKKLNLFVLSICCLISFVNTTFADEKSQAEKTVMEIKQIIMPRVADPYPMRKVLSPEQNAEIKKIHKKRREENRLVEQKKKSLISMAKTNDYVKEILKNEILSNPLKGMNAADYGRDCYAYELMNTLKDIDKYELLNVIKTIYNSDKWDCSSKRVFISYCQQLRSINTNQNTIIDKELRPLIYEAAQNPNKSISTTALQILLGSISEKPPLDKDYGIFLVKEKISKLSNGFDKNFYYKLLQDANVDENEYKAFLRTQIANTNMPIIFRVNYEKQLNSMGENIHIAKDVLNKMVEEGKAEVKDYNK